MIRLLKRYYLSKLNKASESVKNREAVDKFLSDPDNTALVSFPRTGSHWLRMIMELYFERPGLVRVFYYSEKTNYMTYHTHDMELAFEHQTVLYLYRDPVPTIFSQMQYHKQDIHDAEAREKWTKLYARHLQKWLLDEDFTKHKTIINYEGLKNNPEKVFEMICRHFDENFDADKLLSIMDQVSKEEVAKKTTHDPQVIKLKQDYEDLRQEFTEKYGAEVMETTFQFDNRLKELFKK